MKRILTVLCLMIISCPVFAQTTFDSAMKNANAALEKRDYVRAEKYYGIAAREFKKVGQSPAEAIQATAKTTNLDAATLKAQVPAARKFSDEIQNVYYISKDNTTKEFLRMLVMVEDGAKLLVDQPAMLELTNQMLKGAGMQNVSANPATDKAKKEQKDFLEGMYNKSLRDMLAE